MSEQEEPTFTHGDTSYKFSELDDYSQKCYKLVMKVTKEIEQLEADVTIKKAASIYLSTVSYTHLTLPTIYSV